MTVVLILLAVAMLIAGAGALAGAATVMRVDQRNTKRRVDIILSKSESSATGLTGVHARAHDVIRSVLGAGVPESWPSKTSTRTLVIAAVGLGAPVCGVLMLGLRLPFWIWAPGGALGMMILPQMLLRMEQGSLDKKFVDVFPDAIDMIVRMLRAGLPMTAAIAVVGREAASPVKEVFADVSDQMSMGASFDKALVAAGKRVTPQDFKFFTVAAALQQSTGGNLAVTLEMLSEIIRKRRAERMKAKAVTGEVRLSAYVLAAIPFVVIAGMLVISPSYLLPLIQDKRGLMIIGLAVGLLCTGFFVMAQMMKSATRV